VGEAGLVEQSSAEAKSLKLRAKGLSGCHPSGQQPRQPDRGADCQIKNYSYDTLLKETELKAALTGSIRRAKGSPPKKESTTIEKGKDAYSSLLSRGVMSVVMRLLMNENQESQSQVHVTA
jgi:hypothetical protein